MYTQPIVYWSTQQYSHKITDIVILFMFVVVISNKLSIIGHFDYLPLSLSAIKSIGTDFRNTVALD